MTYPKRKTKKPTRLKRFFIGLFFVFLGIIAIVVAVIVNRDWTAPVFVGGFISIGIGLIIAKADAIDIIVSLLEGW